MSHNEYPSDAELLQAAESDSSFRPHGSVLGDLDFWLQRLNPSDPENVDQRHIVEVDAATAKKVNGNLLWYIDRACKVLANDV